MKRLQNGYAKAFGTICNENSLEFITQSSPPTRQRLDVQEKSNVHLFRLQQQLQRKKAQEQLAHLQRQHLAQSSSWSSSSPMFYPFLSQTHVQPHALAQFRHVDLNFASPSSVSPPQLPPVNEPSSSISQRGLRIAATLSVEKARQSLSNTPIDLTNDSPTLIPQLNSNLKKEFLVERIDTDDDIVGAFLRGEIEVANCVVQDRKENKNKH